MDVNINRVLKNRYLIKKKISVGGSSQVYLCEDLVLNREVITKILYKNIFNDKKKESMFVNEIRIILQLKHKNIVKLYDYFIFDKHWCLVLEYLKGVSLRNYIDDKKILTEKQVINFSQQILEALLFASKKKIIHRDIKPENILVINGKNIKIFDFGISIDKFFNRRLFVDNIVGTLKYISPEVITNTKINYQSDLYSLGIIMFEMLVGTTPFYDDNYVNLIKKHLYEKLPSVRNYEPKISQTMENIIIKATAKNVFERYKNAQEMLNELKICKEKKNLNVPKLFLKYDYYKNKIENPLFLYENKKRENYFWLKKNFLVLIFLFQILILIFIIYLATFNLF